MSTENLNTNNISQTLFRFATMRNPELSDPKNKSRRFIFRTTAQIGVFDARVNANTTLQMLCENPASLPLTIETEQSLKNYAPVFYELAVWIARNKARVTKEEFDAKFNPHRGTLSPFWNTDPRLWDNLIYQVVTQKDFYAKETLMQFLHLNHILTVYDGSDEIYQDVINAKVVLPKELFKVPAGENTTTQLPVVAPTVPYNEKNMKFAEATIHLQANEQLASTIVNLEKTYKKEYQEAYQSAYQSYQGEIKPLMDAYQVALNTMESRKNMLENRIKYLTGLSLSNPETFDRDSNIQRELTSLQETVLELNVPSPEIPPFNFSFTPEIQTEVLEGVLTTDEAATLCRIYGKNTVNTALQTVSAYAEITEAIAKNNLQLQQVILGNTVVEQDTYAKVGGVLVPVTNQLTNGSPVPFSVRTYRRNTTSWFLMLTIENLAHNIVSGSYKVTVGGTEITSNTIFQAVNGVSFLFYTGTNIPAALTQNMVSFILSGDVILEDGQTYTLNVILSRDFSETDPVLLQNVFKGSGALTPKGTAEEPGDGEVSGAFIPSGFGMKNIGIADYRKVEQSTYCYVEGDVAHIENIMAREYKEKSTRRLRRSESQTTSSAESEREQQTDTTSSARHEMQSEVAKILQESKDHAANTGFSASYGVPNGPQLSFNTGSNFASHNSKEESNRQAVTEAKEITTRALDRIVTKVREERIDKILEEFEENNKHGFDNSKGSGHVVGVYRWVDKVVKNQIYNYGKRMMFEFMIPEPAKLHKLGMKVSNNMENLLLKPIDPRQATVHKLDNYTSLEDNTRLVYWLSQYNVAVDEMPVENFSISKSFSGRDTSFDGKDDYKVQIVNGNGEVQVPEGYVLTSVDYSLNTYPYSFGGTHKKFLTIGGVSPTLIGNDSATGSVSVPGIKDKLEFSFATGESPVIQGSLRLNLTISREMKNDWLQKTFNKIIDAYETEFAKYEQAVADTKVIADNIKGSNPGFYRKIENTILRRNCISYMINQDTNAALTFGKDSYYANNYSGTGEFLKTDIKVDAKLDAYAAFVKFMEQAFEWEIMSYYFYPYYWGNRKSWADLYQFDDNDPVFRAFMQSGMARVIVTVRPGFEEAVRHYLATGKIWNGGEIPVIDDPLFLSIVDEMRAPKGTKEGEPWRERIPTALTILQADSIGLKVEKALPCNCEPGVKFDDNLGELCGSNFLLNHNQLGQNSDKWMEISFIEMDDFTTIGQLDNGNMFPRVYACMDNTITIDRDANWHPTDPISKVYQAVADEVSQIEGVEAVTTTGNGLTFKINAGRISNFTFRKHGEFDDYELLKFSVDLQNNTLKITSPGYNYYGDERILDKDGQVIPQAEYLDKVPLSKFLL